MISYEFNVAPLMQLVDVKVPLPCEDYIWEYPSVEKVTAEQKSSGILPTSVTTISQGIDELIFSAYSHTARRD